MFTVYALYNKDNNKIYIGQTENLHARIIQHNNKSNLLSKYTKKFSGAWEIVYTEKAHTRSMALIREKQLKSSRGRAYIKSIIEKMRP